MIYINIINLSFKIIKCRPSKTQWSKQWWKKSKNITCQTPQIQWKPNSMNLHSNTLINSRVIMEKMTSKSLNTQKYSTNTKNYLKDHLKILSLNVVFHILTSLRLSKQNKQLNQIQLLVALMKRTILSKCSLPLLITECSCKWWENTRLRID